MTVTGPAELLATWEAGLARRGPARAHLLHRAARPRAADEVLSALPVGARAADLFALRRALFGERMEIRLECAACDEAMEFDLDAGDFAERFARETAADGDAVGRGDAADGGGARDAGEPVPPGSRALAQPGEPGKPGEPLRVVVDGWEIAFRPPTAADLAAAAHAGRRAAGGEGFFGGGGDAFGADGAGGGGATAAEEARFALLRRCVVTVRQDGVPRDVGTAVRALPDRVRQALSEAAATADPGADVTFGVNCPACGEATRAELDIATYLWTELDAWARDLLLDVHLLASAYGWTEPEILALSPLRRRYYLELCADA
ncbi:hypothetical protein [Streptomyces odontomachi]|uniref:hypothetical protein n=1 Tax=Streptomyces odontomachi TaxID=2944940 RepID=UPI00210C448F|nr:hypothetical protein [Streptomyces sp. ODS25]